MQDGTSPKWQLINQQNIKHSPGALAHHTAVVYNNYAYFVGGVKANGTSNTELFKYDIQGNKWEIAR